MSGLGHLSGSMRENRWQCVGCGKESGYPPPNLACPSCGKLMRKIAGPELSKDIDDNRLL